MTVRGVRQWAPAVILPLMLAWCWPHPARAGEPRLTPLQLSAIHEARTIGARYRVADLLVAVIWQESSFCAHRLGDDGRSFGCGQVQLRTARLMAGHAVNARELIRNRTLNLELAARYLSHCIERFGIERGLYCYNHGDQRAAQASRRAVARDAYVRAVLRLYGRLRSLMNGH